MVQGVGGFGKGVEGVARWNGSKLLAQEDSRTMAQSSLQFVLRKPQRVSVLPNFTKMEELQEYTVAVDTPALTDEEQGYLEDVEPGFREIGGRVQSCSRLSFCGVS